MRNHLIISYAFVGKDFRTYTSSFSFSTDTKNGDELSDEIIETANEHAKASYKEEYTDHNVAIQNIFILG